MLKRPRLRAYHSLSPGRVKFTSRRLWLADEIVSRKPLMLNVRGGAAGGACAKAPGAMVPRRAATASVRISSFFMYLSSVVVGFWSLRESVAQCFACRRHATTVLHHPETAAPTLVDDGCPLGRQGGCGVLCNSDLFTAIGLSGSRKYAR